MRNQPDAALPQHPEGLHPVRQRWEPGGWRGGGGPSGSRSRDTCAPSGQLSQVGRQFYNTDIEVEILSKEETEKMTYVVSRSAPCWGPRDLPTSRTEWSFVSSRFTR